MTGPDALTQTAWIALLRTSRRLLDEIESALKTAGLPPLAWYDVLLELEKAGSAGLRPFELTDRLLLPQYGTSRLLDRMVTAGLVERQACAKDGRGHVVTLTPEGRATRGAMWPVYGQILSARLGAALATEEKQQLVALLARL